MPEAMPESIHQCLECETKPTFLTAAGLSSHRKSAHGYVSPHANRWAERKARLAARNHQAAKPVAAVVTEEGIKHTCPECIAKGKPSKEYKNAAGLSSHRKKVHGVGGNSYGARARARKEKEAVQQWCRYDASHGPFKNEHGVHLHERLAHGAIYGKEIVAEIPKGESTNGNVVSAAELSKAFWLGWQAHETLQACEINAQRVGVVSEDYRAEFLAILQGSAKTLRDRYRLPDQL